MEWAAESGGAALVMLEQPTDPAAADDVGCVIVMVRLVDQLQAVERVTSREKSGCRPLPFWYRFAPRLPRLNALKRV